MVPMRLVENTVVIVGCRPDTPTYIPKLSCISRTQSGPIADPSRGPVMWLRLFCLQTLDRRYTTTNITSLVGAPAKFCFASRARSSPFNATRGHSNPGEPHARRVPARPSNTGRQTKWKLDGIAISTPHAGPFSDSIT